MFATEPLLEANQLLRRCEHCWWRLQLPSLCSASSGARVGDGASFACPLLPSISLVSTSRPSSAAFLLSPLLWLLWTLLEFAAGEASTVSAMQLSMQAMVPLWDLLNHVTGKANVRLNHDAKRGCLQMLTTQAVAKGAELVNTYGDLSNGELLRRCASVTADTAGGQGRRAGQHVRRPQQRRAAALVRLCNGWHLG